MNTLKVIELLNKGIEKNTTISTELKEANQKTLSEKEQLEQELATTTFHSTPAQVA